jgi:sulfhydrogenase subunit alpha
MSTTITVEHLARIEGHAGITVELEGKAVRSVRFDIFEGARLLEGLLRGRDYRDVSQIISRICAICSAAHSLTSLKATEDAFGVEASPQTQLLRDLLYRGESMESHALHLFCLAVPDYLNYPSVAALAADHPEAAKLGLRIKKLGNTIQEVVGGRAVHPVNCIVGGFGALPTEEQLIPLRRDLQQGMADCQTAIDILATLPAADFCHTPTVFAALQPPADYGYYHGSRIEVLPNGTADGGLTFAAADYRSLTNEQAVPHSHAKHSLFNGKPFMVGSLARVTAHREKLSDRAKKAIEKLALTLPSDNPMDNNKAQAVELVFDVEYALATVERLLNEGVQPERPAPVRPRAGTGTGVTEAPRGLLVHSYTYDDAGRIVSADVITPTAMNAASIEHHFRCAAEQAAGDSHPTLKKKLEMIARAYDPCVSCSVHLLRVKS